MRDAQLFAFSCAVLACAVWVRVEDLVVAAPPDASAVSVAARLLLWAPLLLVRLFWGWLALNGIVVAVAMRASFSALFGKRDGALPAWSVLAFWPWHALVRAMILHFRTVRFPAEPVLSEILPGWHVGGWPSQRVLAKHPLPLLEHPNTIVVDLTAELPSPHAGPTENYLSIPTMDATAPSQKAIAAAIEFIRTRHAAASAASQPGDASADGADEGPEPPPVVVHCAFGVGRSVTVMCALLVACGHARTCAEAFELVRSKRPCARLNAAYRAALLCWEQSQ